MSNPVARTIISKSCCVADSTIGANCCIPAYEDEAIHCHGTPKLMTENALFARDADAKMDGECCGTKPTHFKAMFTALDGTVEWPFASKILIAALGTVLDGLDTSGVGNAAR